MAPLEGMLVVTVEQAVAAPLCTYRLAEAGARVIKVERPGGDFARAYDRAAKGESSYFVWINQGKESVELDIKAPEDRALLDAMIARADVFVQNLAPGALDRLGLGSAALRTRHPRLITCDISGYGESPELAHMKAYDLLVQAEAGLVAISGGPGEMGRIGVSICDIGAGMTAHAGILEALVQRGVTGKGTGVAVSLFDVAAEWMTVPLIHHETGDGAPGREGLRHPSIAPYGAFVTAEGAVTILSIQNEREWARLCTNVLGQPALAADPRFQDNTARVAHREALEAEMGRIVGQMSCETFRGRLAAAEVAFGALNSVAEVAGHAALRRRSVRTSAEEEISLPAPPIRRSDAAERVLAVPRVGAATEAIRLEFGRGKRNGR